ncbi:uncharacterized protein DS421_20g698410 [Arachis hypogaea]|nr:uncharacterized protein DS421_20g698410 [Arachis hypogaea]
METGVIFYEMDPPYIYEDIVQHMFYVVAAEIRTRIGSTRMLHFTRFMMGRCLTSIPISLRIRRTLSLSPWRSIFIPEPVPEEDIPVEQISVSSSESSSEEPLTASISGPTSAGQTSSTSASAPPEIIEIFDDEDEDPEECSDVVVISSYDDSRVLGAAGPECWVVHSSISEGLLPTLEASRQKEAARTRSEWLRTSPD